MQPKDMAFQPIPGLKTARFAGMSTFMRLPHLELDNPLVDKTDIAIVGVPFDGGTSNRAGPRHGPRQLRDLSTMIRTTHPRSGVNPFKMVNCADLGDAPVNPIDLMQSLDLITDFYNQLTDKGIVPLTAGGDHLISFPILRSLGRDGPVGMIHFDAHTDMNDSYFGNSKYTHGTPFRRAIEQGFLDPKRTIQIGIRGVKYESTDFDWALSQGVRIIEIDEFFDRGVDSIMKEAREIVGDGKTYVSFDIDGIDPSYAPGTGTPEIGGYSTYEAQKMLRALDGLNLIGADLVEVSPPFDPSGGTAWVGVSLMFEMLCVLAPACDARAKSKKT
ncbi:MAG: agmatinase [SAR86 cluster bacterium BACL1 MAG-120813-bin36]|jgi:guanidinopropionase|uniref:agmatinase n=2 Tax=Bacteria TaxID=2 RepID=UPI0007163852|nr:MAG: agmatinase [SAR86 cluster bacterium BACL1 MAG-120813-bin36]